MKFKQFLGNYKPLNEFKEFLSNSSCSCVLLIGENGTGKTTFYEMIVNNNKHDVLLLNDINFNEHSVENFVQCKTITSFFNNLEKLIFIDDVDIITLPKTTLTLLQKLKSKCKIVLTVRKSEEKKINNTWKKLAQSTIYLNRLDYKNCLQVVLRLVSESYDQSDFDIDKMLDLIKAQNCNISTIMMLIETVQYKNENIEVLDDNSDKVNKNIYVVVEKLFHTKLSDKDIDNICLRDTSLLSSMVHENIIDTKMSVQDALDTYDIFTYSDVIDKHIYTTCSWGINWICLNKYRFTALNNVMCKYPKQKNVKFTQQLTKLSSQMNIKKKLKLLNNQEIVDNIFDIICVINKFKIEIDDKNVKDLIYKFKKDFDI